MFGAQPAYAQQIAVVFMEPQGEAAQETELPVFQAVTDSTRLATYESWLDNDAARWAVKLYGQALEAVDSGSSEVPPPRALHIALVPNGNHAAVGFRLASHNETTTYERAAYVVLGPQDWRFGITLLHEVGHVVVRTLRHGVALPRQKVAAISHTTAALTDRTTAFDEGFAISLEALIVHLSDERNLRNKYRHEQMLFGVWPGMLAEYYRQSVDLMSFSQTVSRYYMVRENAFAFATAVTEPDYLRVQLEKGRDYSELRGPNQLLQSEGFYASFFFSLVTRGTTVPSKAIAEERQRNVVGALAVLLDDEGLTVDTPYMLRFVSVFSDRFPDEREDVLDVLLDLSHGVFVDPEAKSIWRRHYLGALQLDMNAVDREGIEARRADWKSVALANPESLSSRLGPQVPCAVPSVTVGIARLGLSDPLSFDINSVQEGVLRLIPGIRDAEVERWLTERDARSFADAQDLIARASLTQSTLKQLACRN